MGRSAGWCGVATGALVACLLVVGSLSSRASLADAVPHWFCLGSIDMPASSCQNGKRTRALADYSNANFEPPACNHRRRYDGDCNYSRHELGVCSEDVIDRFVRLDACPSRDLLE